MNLFSKNITIKYDKNIIIDNQSFEIKIGKINVFLGKNGSGKSTIFKSLCKQLNVSSGQILLNNQNIKNIKNKNFAKEVGILFQENSITGDLTVKELISYGRFPYIGLYSEISKEDEEYINNAMEMTNTIQYQNKQINELSSGQKQMVWIAMLLAQNSNIMLFDEPTTYLDLKNQYEVMNCIEKINKTLKKTIIIILHDINLASQYADYIFMIKDGKIKYHGDTNKLLTEQIIKDVYDINVSIIKMNETMFICPIKENI